MVIVGAVGGNDGEEAIRVAQRNLDGKRIASMEWPLQARDAVHDEENVSGATRWGAAVRKNYQASRERWRGSGPDGAFAMRPDRR